MKKITYMFYFFGLVLIPVILLILPIDFFDSGNTICLSVLLIDTECYACGMTRAVHRLIHFDFLAAYELNKLSIIVFPLLIFVYVREFSRLFRLLF